MTAKKTILRVKELSIGFSHRPVIRQLNFDLHAGETLAIMATGFL